MLEIETNLKLVCHFLTTPQKSLKLPSAWKCICNGTIFVLMRQLKDLALKRLKSYDLFLAKVHCTLAYWNLIIFIVFFSVDSSRNGRSWSYNCITTWSFPVDIFLAQCSPVRMACLSVGLVSINMRCYRFQIK